MDQDIGASQIWEAFRTKLMNDSLGESDFTSEMKDILMSFLVGANTEQRRLKYANAPVEFYDALNKAIVIAKSADGDYRFDFVKENDAIRLSFVEGITIPVNKIDTLPFDQFAPLPDQEIWIRNELSISGTISLYCQTKGLFGKEKAMKLFRDGAGTSIAARSWVPFFEDRLAFVVYTAWIENRINGENVSIDAFSDSLCVIRLKNHLWRRLYQTAGHLRVQIPYKEYMELFENIWRDRAIKNGWQLSIGFDYNDTVLSFRDIGAPVK